VQSDNTEDLVQLSLQDDDPVIVESQEISQSTSVGEDPVFENVEEPTEDLISETSEHISGN
jgi:hypothetical protein